MDHACPIVACCMTAALNSCLNAYSQSSDSCTKEKSALGQLILNAGVRTARILNGPKPMKAIAKQEVVASL